MITAPPAKALVSREKGSGNIVYELSQRNSYLQFRVLNSKTSLLFAGQNDLFYDCYRVYDGFGASITHLFEVNLSSSSGMVFAIRCTGLSMCTIYDTREIGAALIDLFNRTTLFTRRSHCIVVSLPPNRRCLKSIRTLRLNSKVLVNLYA